MRGRYAPSPSGLLHVGNARTALAAWLSARSAGGAFVMRIEDLDGPRVVPGMVNAALRDLAWLGIDWDEGPVFDPAQGTWTGERGACGPYRQSERGAVYADALARLAASERLFACRRSRRDLAGLASAPHGAAATAAMPGEGLPPYPRAWRPAERLSPEAAAAPLDAAVRFVVEDGLVCVGDRVQGRVCQDVAAEVGDVVLRRRDGVVGYQLAVVADDLAMGVTEVVRGADLLDSTARQVQLIRALGGRVPAYAHLGLVVNADGAKLSKREAALSLAALRDAGASPESVCGWLAASLGIADDVRPVRAADLIARFAWPHVPAGPVVAGDDLAAFGVGCR